MVVKNINPLNTIAEIQVSYSTVNTPKNKISSGNDAFDLLLSTWDKGSLELQEEFKVLLLNRANEVLGLYSMSKGGVSGTVVDVKLIFAVALKCNASSIIITHNHPSGNLKPSDADISLTNKIKNCSEFLDISLLDHLIITKNGFYSFSENSLLS
jgi:DNA repair protein RadC